jgi:hypothetical protein
MNEMLEQRGSGSKPGPSLSALLTGLAEWRRPYQRLSCIRPPVRMRVLTVVPLQPLFDPFFKLDRAAEVSAFEEFTHQNAEEQFHLVQPRPVLGRKVKHVLVVRVAQKRTPLRSRFQFLFRHLDTAPTRHQQAHGQAPMGVQVVYHPVILSHVWHLPIHVLEVRHPVAGCACLSQIPYHLSCRHAERRQQRPCAQTFILELAFFWFSWLRWLRRVDTVQNLHAGFLIATKDQAAFFFQKTWCVKVQPTKGSGYRIEIRIVTVQPIDTLVRFQVGLGENALDRGTAHETVAGFPRSGQSFLVGLFASVVQAGLLRYLFEMAKEVFLIGLLVDQGECQLVQSPRGVGTVVLGGFATGQGDDREPFLGGKSSGVCRSEGRLADLPGRGR